jgi:RNA polymerase sigma-70 factor (ECF subfamily)
LNVDAERELIERAKRGDEPAFAEIVRTHRSCVYRVCLAALGDPAAADEAAQDVFVRLYERLKQFRGESRLSTWLYRVAFNVCADRRRAIWWRRWLGLDSVDPAAPESVRPDRQAEESESVRLLGAALNRLPREFRDVLILRELEEREYADIAGILDIPVGTVESRLFRGREKLRRELSDLGLNDKG